MKAAVITRYGSPEVVKILDRPKPTPATHEVLIRVYATTVNRTDCGELRAHPFFMRCFYGARRPRRTIFGLDVAGEVEAVGAGTRAFKPGDRVFGMCPSRSNGAHAEYVTVPERTVATMPGGTRFEEAVVCEGAFYAHAVLKKINLRAGQTILIYGASGAIESNQIRGCASHNEDRSIVRCNYKRRDRPVERPDAAVSVLPCYYLPDLAMG
jgi:NADPH:quinone reductase-like Zn-dependent oxidoreductase